MNEVLSTLLYLYIIQLLIVFFMLIFTTDGGPIFKSKKEVYMASIPCIWMVGLVLMATRTFKELK